MHKRLIKAYIVALLIYQYLQNISSAKVLSMLHLSYKFINKKPKHCVQSYMNLLRIVNYTCYIKYKHEGITPVPVQSQAFRQFFVYNNTWILHDFKWFDHILFIS